MEEKGECVNIKKFVNESEDMQEESTKSSKGKAVQISQSPIISKNELNICETENSV